MSLIASEDQLQIQAATRTAFEREFPLGEVADRSVAGAAAIDGWRRRAAELSISALAVPEASGGLGMSFADLAPVIEEGGRALCPDPLVSTTAIATALLLRCAEDSVPELLEGIADGTRVVAVAMSECGVGPWESAHVVASVSRQDEVRLDGVKRLVLDGDIADSYLVFARHRESLALFRVDKGSDVSAELRASLDATRRHADVTFAGAPARLLSEDGESLWSLAVQVGSVAMALDAVGGARKCLELAVEYAGTREQFGKPIGSFQAIKHLCADMLLQVETAASAAAGAVAALSSGEESGLRTASLAKAYCTEAYSFVAGATIQILGGIGFTWEHPAHWFFKRAKADELWFGSPSWHRGRLAADLQLHESVLST